MTEIEDLRIRVEKLDQEIMKMKENLLKYIDIVELSRKLDDYKDNEKFVGR